MLFQKIMVFSLRLCKYILYRKKSKRMFAIYMLLRFWFIKLAYTKKKLVALKKCQHLEQCYFYLQST